MKRLTLTLVALFTVAALAPTASDAMVTVTYTADNVIGAWFQNGGAPVAQATGPNAGNWRIADTAVLNLAPGSYQMIFRVANIGTGGAGNPAALLAEISGPGVSGDLLTSTTWDWALAGGMDPANFNTLFWSAATSYGTNAGPNIWTNNNGGQPVAGISNNAEWIWNSPNFTSNMDPELYLRAQFEVVPEPVSITLLGVGILGLAGVGLLRRRR